MYHKTVLILVSIFPIILSFFNYQPRLNINALQNNKNNYNNNNEYPYAKEYYDFYRKYKKPSLFQVTPFINYKEFAERRRKNYLIFSDNYDLIENTKNKMNLNNNSFSIELNKYADIIDFNSMSQPDLNFKLTNSNNKINKFNFSPYFRAIKKPAVFFGNLFSIKKFSWNDTGLLSPVKNQGQCGSCWAFATTNVLETFMRINNYTIDRLSEQQLVDCSEEDYGCDGGFMHTALDYIIQNDGLLDNKIYPYKGNTNNCSCLVNNTKNAIGSNIKDYDFTIPNSIIDMKKNVMETPIAIAIDASNIYFRFYKNGIIDVPLNESRALNHAVVLVGFDHDDDGMYWIIQNSWGSDWGDHGFCKVRVQPGDGTLMSQVYGVYPTQ